MIFFAAICDVSDTMYRPLASLHTQVNRYPQDYHVFHVCFFY